MNTYNLPNPVKGYVIENDSFAPGCIRGLIKDNPEVFSDVKTITYARHRQSEVIHDLQTSDVNTIIVSSTFMYKDQLEDLVNFIEHGLNRKLTFIVEHISDNLNSWYHCRSWEKPNFDNYDKFMGIVKQWVEEGRIFELAQDYNSKIVIHDDCHTWSNSFEHHNRQPWIIKKILFSNQLNIFHEDGDDEKHLTQVSERYKRNAI